MSHKKLIRFLRVCPASEFFGALKSTLSTKTLSYSAAIKIVKRLVQENMIVMKQTLHQVEELDPHFEESVKSDDIDVI